MTDRKFFLRAVLTSALCLFLSVGAHAAPETPAASENGQESESVEIVDVAPAQLQDTFDYSGLLSADDPRNGAVAPSETYEIDPHTGNARAEVVEGETDTFYPLSDGVFGFDKIARNYVNFVGTRSFTSNVPNGALLTAGTQVTIQIPAGLTGILYRDGDVVPEPNLLQIDETGSYFLSVKDSSGNSGDFTFSILNDVVNNVAEFSLPDGFRFTDVRLDDEEMEPEFSNYCEFLDDGRYRISWACEPIGQSFSLVFVLDTETPELTISGLTKEPPNGEAHGPVTLSWTDENAYLVVRSDDGKEHRIASSPTEIKESGSYTVTIRDVAGNSASYSFIIHVYLNISAYAAIALALAGVVCLIVYSRRVKRHSRVG